MPYIIEGVPQVGKTAFVRSLKDVFVVKDSSLSREKIAQENVQRIQLTLFKTIPILNDDRIIFDRFYPSEIVFGQDRYNIDMDFYKNIDAEFSKLNFKMIFLSVPYSSIQKPRYTLDEYLKWQKRYYDFMQWTKLPVEMFCKSYAENAFELEQYFRKNK